MKKKYLLFSFLFISHLLFAQAHTDFIGIGNANGVVVSSSDSGSNGLNTVNGHGYELELQQASRFLAHATLGATMEDIESLTELGIDQWIDEQMELPTSSYTVTTVEVITELFERCQDQLGLLCLGQFNLNSYHWRYAQWHNMMTEDDHLRQRVALALSEILVISDQSQLTNYPHAMAYYYDILMNSAFGNYKDLLRNVTLSPAMGFYLSHFNNPKTQVDLNIRPDENYAREIMQLFSIGLYQLNQDGSRKLDPNTGLWIPTYDQTDIQGMAKVFTGLSGSKWEDENDMTNVVFGRNFRRYSKIDPLTMYDSWHEPGEKAIFDGHVIPAGQTGMEDIEETIDHLFNHQNVGPFLARRLIQRLVKSNPTPSYIERIANTFNDNGSGVRGDLAAVIKAILTDAEALECFWIDDIQNGMLKAPFLRYTQMMKGLEAKPQSEWYWNAGRYFQDQTDHYILSSPTVFNHYTPDYVPDDDFAYLNMEGPEFQILNSSTSSNYVNWMILALNDDYFLEHYDFELADLLNESFAIPYTEDTEPYEAHFTNEKWIELNTKPKQQLDYLDLLLTHGQLSDDFKTRVQESMALTDVFREEEAALYALLMIMIDPDYVILK